MLGAGTKVMDFMRLVGGESPDQTMQRHGGEDKLSVIPSVRSVQGRGDLP
jgi:hypothetical protein